VSTRTSTIDDLADAVGVGAEEMAGALYPSGERSAEAWESGRHGR
jgi:hypothetical protein